MSSRPERRLRIDPHVHSAASRDGREPVERLLARAAAVGLDGVVVTDHDEIAASRRAAALAPEYGLVGIPGVEVSSADGHVLALGVAERPARGRPFAETVAEIRDLGGAAVVPHPFQRTKHGIGRDALAACDPDGIETRNASALTGVRNRAADRFADRRDLPKLGGSDAHVAATVGRSCTAVTVETDARSPAEVDPSAIVDAVRGGAVAPRGRSVAPGAFVATHAAGVGARTREVLGLGRRRDDRSPGPTLENRSQKRS